MTDNGKTCDTLLTASYCVTQNAKREVIKDAAVAIKDGRIVALGPSSAMQDWKSNDLRHMGRALIMPGLVNAHTHAAMTFLRGLGDDMPLMEWLEKRIFPVEAKLTAEIVYTASLMAFAEMLASGTTACLDMYYFTKDVLRAAQQSGIRCMAGEAVIGFPNAACKTWQESLAVMEELQGDTLAQGRCSLVVSPHAVYTTTPEILLACRDFAASHDLPLHIHLSETVDETARCLETQGKRPVAYLNDLGLLDLPVTLAHVVDVTEEELDLLASKPHLAVAHNPSSNMKLASGTAPVPAMLERGIAVFLGTDGAASNNTLNIFSEMRQCALLHKLVHRDPTVMPAQTVLDMATRPGLPGLRATACGSLEVGGTADLIVLDLTAPHMQPLYEPVSHLTYVATGAEVLLTMVEGEVLFEKGKFAHFDLFALRQEMDKLCAYTRKLVA